MSDEGFTLTCATGAQGKCVRFGYKPWKTLSNGVVLADYHQACVRLVREHARWSKRDLSAKRYVYFWVDGIHVQARLEDAAQCLLVIIGATPEGRKELVGLIDGVRESAQSWRELLLT